MNSNPYIQLLEPFLECFEKTKALAEKLDEISMSQDFMGVFALAQTHGMPYMGPSYATELEAVKESLRKLEELPVPKEEI